MRLKQAYLRQVTHHTLQVEEITRIARHVQVFQRVEQEAQRRYVQH
jgi:hypothetical protein